MKKRILRVIALVLAICAMQVAFVPAVSAETLQTAEYDFYTPCKSYSYVYHYSNSSTAQSTIASQFDGGTLNWKIETFSSYANVERKYSESLQGASYIDMLQGVGAYTAFRLRSPGTGEYSVDLNYVVRNVATTYDSDGKITRGANAAAEITIVPATQDSYTTAEISALAAQNRAQLTISCYDASASKSTIKTATFSYSFLEGNDYLLIVRGGPSYGDSTTYGGTYLRSLDVTRVGDYVAPEEETFPRPVTVLEEALTRWEEGFPMVAEADDGTDYLAIPIYGGKMYVFNLETNKLVDVVNTGIGTPRGAAADDNGVIYIVGAAYHIFMYDLKTNAPKKSTNVNISGVSFGSLYDISYGDDGMLYTGTDNGHIIRYDPDTDTVTAIHLTNYGITDPTFVSSVLQQGDYIYAAVTNKAKEHYLVKLTNAETAELVGTVEYTSTDPATYMSYMSITEDGLILGNATNLMAVDTNTMTLLEEEEFSSARVQCYASEAINGKYYYVSSVDRYMYCYDPATGTVEKTKTHVGQFFDCHGKTVTLDRDGDGEDEQYLLAIEDAKTSKITLVDPVNNTAFQLKLPIDENAGASTGVNSLTAGVAGTNELYFGGFTSNQLHIYNTATGKITDKIKTSGIQVDAIYVNEDAVNNAYTIFVGNYTEAELTRLNRETNKPDVLFALHNSPFDQSRIHSVTAGENKVFVGTFPYVYKHGGVLAWFNLADDCTYVVAGPTANDVYYGKTFDSATGTSIAVNDVVWYNEVSGEQVTAIANWTGVVTNQGIKEVAYHNGILYAATSRSGGTNTSFVDGTSAVIIAYDIAARQVIATFDPRDQGFGGPVPTISGIEVDENGTLWCIVSETLFTLTLDKTTKTFTYNEVRSFDKYSYDATQNRANSDILFKDGYVYAAFERKGGLCRINMANYSDYDLLLPNVTSNGQVPNSFAFGEDGNLYFLLGSSLKMMPLNDTEEEWTAADAVTAQIAAITGESTSVEIVEIRAAYEALTVREKSLVQNYDVLVQAEADALIADIDALGEITWEKKEQVEALRAIYQAMPMSQQELVTNYYVLAAAYQTLLQIEANSPVAVTHTSGDKTYYQTLSEALENAAAGDAFTLQDNVTEGAIDLGAYVLDLNGYTVTATSFVGAVKDSSDGKGFVQVAEKDNAILTSANGQLILWDNAEMGYRLFDYTFTNEGMDLRGDDAFYSAKSFWCDLTFTNTYAYTLVASTESTLQLYYEMTWTPDEGEKVSAIYDLADYLEAWALDEEKNDGTKNYCFYASVAGFEKLTESGTVTLKPVLKTAFNTQSNTAMSDRYEYVEPVIPELKYEWGFGVVPA